MAISDFPVLSMLTKKDSQVWLTNRTNILPISRFCHLWQSIYEKNWITKFRSEILLKNSSRGSSNILKISVQTDMFFLRYWIFKNSHVSQGKVWKPNVFNIWYLNSNISFSTETFQSILRFTRPIYRQNYRLKWIAYGNEPL